MPPHRKGIRATETRRRGERLLTLSEDDSSDSLPEYSAIEVQYQTSSKLRHTQVRQHLSHVYPVEAFDALDLNYHAIFDN